MECYGENPLNRGNRYIEAREILEFNIETNERYAAFATIDIILQSFSVKKLSLFAFNMLGI